MHMNAKLRMQLSYINIFFIIIIIIIYITNFVIQTRI